MTARRWACARRARFHRLSPRMISHAVSFSCSRPCWPMLSCWPSCVSIYIFLFAKADYFLQDLPSGLHNLYHRRTGYRRGRVWKVWRRGRSRPTLDLVCRMACSHLLDLALLATRYISNLGTVPVSTDEWCLYMPCLSPFYDIRVDSAILI